MKIGGIRKFSTLDYPGNICITVFTKGCNFCCPFCHNAPLVTGGEKNEITKDELFTFLKKRVGLVDAVCLTGGEPLLNDEKEVLDFLRGIKDLGYKVKLDTNGSFPKKLEFLINQGALDYVAMDIKNSPSAYSLTCGVDVDVNAVKESVALLMNGKVDFEFRTTVLRDFHTIERMIEIGKLIAGNEKYFLQAFVPSENVIKQGLSPFSRDEIESLRQAVLPYVPKVEIRGV